MQSSEKQSLRVLLTQRQGRGFSEADVREVLRQILPQLAQLHSEGKSHGTISLDTLVQRDGQIAIALPPTSQAVSKARILKDIYDLGAAMIELLTTKAPNLLRNSDGSWNWEDDCVVTDQLAAVINQMLGDNQQKSFNSTNEILSALGFTDIQASVVVSLTPEPASFALNTKLFGFGLDGISKKNVEEKNFKWQVISLAVLGLFMAVTNPSKNDYVAYEHKRFQESFLGYATHTICDSYKFYNYNKYRMPIDDHTKICYKTVNEVLKAQDDNYVLSSISESTEVHNFILFSIYNTKYSKLFNIIEHQIEVNLELEIKNFLSAQKPEYFLNEEPSKTTDQTNSLANITIGIFGQIIDSTAQNEFDD